MNIIDKIDEIINTVSFEKDMREVIRAKKHPSKNDQTDNCTD